MPQPRRSAGADVLAESYRLLDALLGLEERAFDEIDRAFLEHLPLARRSMSSLSPERLLTDQAAWLGLQHAADLAAGQAGAAALVLTAQATQLAAESIAVQLQLCADTLTAKWSHLADAGMAAAEAHIDVILHDAATQFAAAAAGVGVVLVDRVRALLSAATVEDALLDPDVVFGAGRSPMGIWWTPTTTLKRVARSVEFEAVNAVRHLAMDGFNAAGS